MSAVFYITPVNIIGENALTYSVQEIVSLGFRKALIVTDKPLSDLGFPSQVQGLLKEKNIDSVIFDRVHPNPTVSNVEDGLEVLKQNECDFIISLGGGSPHDCAKGIALVATNGGSIKDYEGLDRSEKPQLPLVSINTTAGTASEITRFTIITNEDTHVKMAIVDKHVTPIISVNDPVLMEDMPQSLTAATGMDALTHAVEAYVSTAATPITDACAIKSVELIHQHLKNAVFHGMDIEEREGMAYAQLLAGMAFNNASLGYVHAMAHQLGGFYDLPHGVCNAVLLPHVQRFNSSSETAGKRLGHIARALGVDTSNMDHNEAADSAIQAIVDLSREIGIPSGLKELGAKEEDFPTLAANALKDACGLTNPIQPSHEEVIEIFKAAL